MFMPQQIVETERKHLDPKIKILWALSAVLTALVVWLFASWISPLAFPNEIFGVSSALYPLMFFMIIGIILLPYLAWVELKYRNYTYSISKNELVIRKGVMRVERITIPFEKVQNVNVSRSIFERILGLATLKIETAGTNPGEAEGILPGITHYHDLMDEILIRIEHAQTLIPQKTPKNLPHLSETAELMKEICALREELRKLREEKENLFGNKQKKNHPLLD